MKSALSVLSMIFVFASLPSSLHALALEGKAGLGLGALSPPGVRIGDLKPSEEVKGVLAVAATYEGILRFSRRISIGLRFMPVVYSYTQDPLGGNWELSEQLYSWDLFGKLNLTRGKIRMYGTLGAGIFLQGRAGKDETGKFNVSIDKDIGLHAALGPGIELSVSPKFFFFGETLVHYYDPKQEIINSQSILNTAGSKGFLAGTVTVGIGYSFSPRIF